MTRLATAEDMPTIAEIYGRTFHDRFSVNRDNIVPSEIAADFLESVNKHDVFLVESQNNNILGFLQTSQCFRFLSKLYVTPESQGHGIGHVLIGAYLKEAKLRLTEDSKLWLEVDDFNYQAKNLYESFGYKESGLQRVEKVADKSLLILERHVNL